MLEKILVPLDGSELAESVLPLVEELATKLQAEVVLLQATMTPSQALTEVVDPNSPTMATEVSLDVANRRVESNVEGAERYLAATQTRLMDKGVRVTAAVMPGNPENVILEYAAQNNVSLIALASHGRGGIVRTVLGSVADALVRNAPIPVLIARAQA